MSGSGLVHWMVVARGFAGSLSGHRASESTWSFIWLLYVITGTFTHARGRSLERIASSKSLDSIRPQSVMQMRACMGRRSMGISRITSSSHSGDLHKSNQHRAEKETSYMIGTDLERRSGVSSTSP